MTKPIWSSYSDSTSFPKLEKNIDLDVAIIGGGITGITSAELLSKAGIRVGVIEKFNVGTQSSGHSTGNLYSAFHDILNDVRQKFGDETMEKVIEARAEAISLVERNVNEFEIDCDFKRVNWNFYTAITKNNTKIEKAFDAAQKVGLRTYYSDLPGTGFPVKKGMTIEHAAAQFNPQRYVQGLANKIVSSICQIFENTEIAEVHETSSGVELKTREGHVINAKYVIHATHTPKGIMSYHMELAPYREYGVAARFKGEHPEGVYFGYYSPTYTTSTRIYERKGERYLMAIGEPHKVGHGNNLENINRLKSFLKDQFNLTEFSHTWGAQNYKTPDHLPYIGPRVEGSPISIATGFSSHGLTYGTVAAKILSDQILEIHNAYGEIFSPSRLNPLKSAPAMIKENLDVLYNFVKDYLPKAQKEKLIDVKLGEGVVIEEEGHKLAVFRNDDDGLQVSSAVCSHMGCIVHWNSAEKSWDCPCHGSRFDTSGEVLEGPALRALTKLSDLLDQDGNLIPFGASVAEHRPHVMSLDEEIDEEGMESFPASDPPGHFSHSAVDKEQHKRV